MAAKWEVGQRVYVHRPYHDDDDWGWDDDWYEPEMVTIPRCLYDQLCADSDRLARIEPVYEQMRETQQAQINYSLSPQRMFDMLALMEAGRKGGDHA